MCQNQELSKVDKVEKVSSIIKSFVTVLAVIVGAWWTWHTFSVLGQKAKSDLEIEDLRHRESVLNFELKAAERTLINDKNHYIEIAVHVRNAGNSDVSLCFENPDDKKDATKTNCGVKAGYPCNAPPGLNGLPSVLPPLHIVRLISAGEKSNQLISDKDEDFTATTYRDCPQGPVPVTEMRVQVGQTESYSTGVVVHKTGLYRVSFLAYVTDEQMEREMKSKSPSFVPLSRATRPFWKAETFLVVEGAGRSAHQTSP